MHNKLSCTTILPRTDGNKMCRDTFLYEIKVFFLFSKTKVRDPSIANNAQIAHPAFMKPNVIRNIWYLFGEGVSVYQYMEIYCYICILYLFSWWWWWYYDCNHNDQLERRIFCQQLFIITYHILFSRNHLMISWKSTARACPILTCNHSPCFKLITHCNFTACLSQSRVRDTFQPKWISYAICLDMFHVDIHSIWNNFVCNVLNYLTHAQLVL